MPILNGRMRGMKWIVGSFDHGCWLGHYEYKIRQLFERTIREGDVVFDIGANVGFYTLLSSILVGGKGTVYAFEPLPQNLVYLKKHIQLNQIGNVVIIEAAVCETSGESSFTRRGATSHISQAGSLFVKTVSLDDLFSCGTIPAPNCLKIDVEGGELSALLGMTRLIRESRPKIFLELHRGRDSRIPKKCVDLLMSFGYKLKSLDEQELENSYHILATTFI